MFTVSCFGKKVLRQLFSLITQVTLQISNERFEQKIVNFIQITEKLTDLYILLKHQNSSTKDIVWSITPEISMWAHALCQLRLRAMGIVIASCYVLTINPGRSLCNNFYQYPNSVTQY